MPPRRRRVKRGAATFVKSSSFTDFKWNNAHFIGLDAEGVRSIVD